MSISKGKALQGQLQELGDDLEASVVGQTDGIGTIMGSLERYAAGLHDNKRPIGAFLLIGPTGVGKTFLVEKFAELTQPAESFIKIDCAEYQLDHEVAKLFGAPPGYVGHDTGSILTRRLNAIKEPENGFILLLDEIEKAHPKFFDSWLAVMDSGILTDSKGNRLDFSRSMIFLTSNVGAGHFAEAKDLGFRGSRPSASSIRGLVEGDLKRTFRPEFLNRLSGKIYFDLLTSEQQDKIFDCLISDLNVRLSRYYVQVDLGPRLRHAITRDGFSREYGAREIKRTIVKKLELPLAKKIVSGEIAEDSLVFIELDQNGEFTAERKGDYPVLDQLFNTNS
jgi:ATP-dependent Clp protease ATP-binding subunit ClpC